jgi:hypothetical protein
LAPLVLSLSHRAIKNLLARSLLSMWSFWGLHLPYTINFWWCHCSYTFYTGFLLLYPGVKGLCLHRPENWLMRQLNDESKPVYKVGFIREKGKATVKVLRWSPETSGSLHRWRLGFLWMFQLWVGVFLIGLAFQGLSQVNWFS